MITVVIHDLLSGRVPVPLEEKEIPDDSGFPVLEIVLGVDVNIRLDDNTTIFYPVGTILNRVAATAELQNDALKIERIEDIKTLDPATTVHTSLQELEGEGFLDGFKEEWLITRSIGGKTMAILRFNLEIEIPEEPKLFVSAGARWAECIRLIERKAFGEIPQKQEGPRTETIACDRKGWVAGAYLLREGAIPDDLMELSKNILNDED